jgi:hypothetical protein
VPHGGLSILSDASYEKIPLVWPGRDAEGQADEAVALINQVEDDCGPERARLGALLRRLG